MSRIRRLKENRRKNTIKTTMASLALILAIGSTPVMGTYALFTDTVDVPSDLSISTGDVDVRVDDGFNITIEDDYYIKDNEQIQKNHKFNIYNDGTLKQNISLSLDYNSNMNIDGYISYDLKFDNYHNRAIKPVKLSKQNIELRYVDNNELVELKKEEYISVTGTLTINEDVKKIVKDSDETDITFNLNVLSTQTNKRKLINEKGFYNRESQVNHIKIIDYDDDNILSGGSIKVAPDDTIHLSVYGQGKFHGLNSIIPDMKNIINREVFVGTGTGVFSNKDIKLTSSNNWYYLSPVNTKGIGNSFGKDKISIKLYYDYDKDNKADTYRIYELSFRAIGEEANGCRILEALVTFKEEGKTIVLEEDSKTEYKPEELEHQNGEVVPPNDSNITIESETEEVVPPNDSELTEHTKVEEKLDNSKSDTIEPEKEDIEIQ